MAFPDVPNFRRIANTRLYRSSKLDSLNEEGVKRLKTLGVTTVIDLRSPEGWGESITYTDSLGAAYEAISVKPCGTGRDGTVRLQYKVLKDHNSVNTIQPRPRGRRLFLNLINFKFALGQMKTILPWYLMLWILILMIFFVLFRIRLFLKEFGRLVMNPLGIIGQYRSIVKYCQQSILVTLSLIADPSNVPTVVCCAQGKDRTGIISALVMSMCGATREEIINEYAASAGHINKIRKEMEHYMDAYYLSPEFSTAKSETMEALLDYIDQEYGSISKYLESIGFSKDKQEQLRENVAA